MHSPPKFGRKMEVHLIVRMLLTWRSGRGQQWSRVTGGRRRVTAAGSQQQQEWDNAAGPRLGGGGVPKV